MKSASLRKESVMTQLAGEQRISLSFSDRCKRAFLGSAQIVAYDIATRIALATSAERGSPAPSSGAHDRIELPEPERAHADGLTPQAVDSGGK
jgi:hypothetical protein